MTDDYNKKIGVQKEVLEALPRNNAKNNKLYKEKVIELKEQYDILCFYLKKLLRERTST